MDKFNLAKCPPPRILFGFGRLIANFRLLFITILITSLLFVDGYSQYGYEVSNQLPGCGTISGGETQALGVGCSQGFSSFLANHKDDMIPQNVTRTVKLKLNVLFMQRNDGSGNFTMSNPEHSDYWNKIFEEINSRLSDLVEIPCGCNSDPQYYSNIHLEFVPNFVEVRDEYGWNHQNDGPTYSLNSYNKPFLNYIHNRASQEPNYEPGIDIAITNNKLTYDAYMQNDLPLWEIPGLPSDYGPYIYSSLPTGDINHQAIWHFPHLYLGYLNAVEHIGMDFVNGPEFDFIVGAIMHETSHMMVYPWTSNGNSVGHVTCGSNVMNPSTANRVSYTGCQVRSIYRALMTSYVRKYVICEDVLEHDITINSDEEWKNNMRIYSNVVVKKGNTLKISCELYMQPQTRIIVERGARLILGKEAIIANGGVCNDEDSSKKWAGIVLEGNNSIAHKTDYADESYSLVADDHGIVLLMDGSIVRDARTAVSCRSLSGSGDYWGGYINAKGVSFLNNGRSLEFMLSNFPNLSEIDDCLFEGGPVAITNWHSNNVTIRNSEFNHFEQGIYSIDAGMNVIHNTFNNNVDAIAMDNMQFLNHVYFVKNNTFNYNDVSIRASASSSLIVKNNDFLNNDFGVSLMGNGQAVIRNNLFEDNSLGVDLQSVGNAWTPVSCNIFSHNSYGVNPSGNNLGMYYVKNQNDVIDNYSDMFIENDEDGNLGRVSDFGSSYLPPMNTFSQGNNDRNIQTKAGEVVQFVYFAPDVDLLVPQCYIGDVDCQDMENNFNWMFASNEFNVPCGKIGTYDGDDGGSNKFPDLAIADEVIDKDDVVVKESIMNALENNNGIVLAGEAGRKLLSISQQFVAEDRYEDLGEYLDQFGDAVLYLKYSVAVHRKDYVQAASYLDDLEAKGGYNDYVFPQRVYLDWVQNGTPPTSNNVLVALAQKDSPEAAYSRSMLGILYGQRFAPKMPEDNGADRVGFRASSLELANTNASIVPNPFDFDVVVETSDFENGQISIYSVLGELMYSKPISEDKMTINTESWESGIYFMYLSNVAGDTRFEKIVKN